MITINVRHALFFMVIGFIIAKVVDRELENFHYEEFKQSIVSRL